MKTFKIHFIRHGLTQANLDGKYIGSTDVPLCQEGINRLNDLKNTYNYPTATIIYSSPLKRCVETSNILYPNASIKTLPGLAEFDFGQWEGKAAEELKGNAEFFRWLSGKESAETALGETMQNFSKRICTTLENIVTETIKNQRESTVVVTHGGVIMVLLAIYGLPEAKVTDWIVGNGCGYSVRVTPSLFMRDKRFEVYAKIPEQSIHEKAETAYIHDLF